MTRKVVVWTPGTRDERLAGGRDGERGDRRRSGADRMSAAPGSWRVATAAREEPRRRQLWCSVMLRQRLPLRSAGANRLRASGAFLLRP